LTVARRGLPAALQAWVEARRRFHLSHAQVQMARELGLNPRKLGKLDNHDQEPWKLPLPLFIERLYLRRFGKARPELVMSLEERAHVLDARKAVKRAAKERRRQARAAAGPQREQGPEPDRAGAASSDRGSG